MENFENNKLYQTIKDVSENGTIQQRADRLVERRRVAKTEEEREQIKYEMWELNKLIKETINGIVEVVPVDMFIEHFGIDEYDDKDDYYRNLMSSNTNLGKVIRSALIYSEKIVHNIFKNEDCE